MFGKQERDVSNGAGAYPITVSPHLTVVAAARSSATTVQGRVGDTEVEVMLDSGASVSLVREDTATRLLGSQPVSEASVHVISATGEPIPVLGLVILPVQVRPIEVDHPLVVVQSLITPVILGINFLQAHGLILDFTTTPVHVTTQPTSDSSRKESAQQVLYDARKTKARVCTVLESA